MGYGRTAQNLPSLLLPPSSRFLHPSATFLLLSSHHRTGRAAARPVLHLLSFFAHDSCLLDSCIPPSDSCLPPLDSQFPPLDSYLPLQPSFLAPHCPHKARCGAPCAIAILLLAHSSCFLFSLLPPTCVEVHLGTVPDVRHIVILGESRSRMLIMLGTEPQAPYRCSGPP